MDVTVIILILGFVAGIVSGVGSYRYTGFSLFGGLFIQGLFYAIAVGIALSELTGKRHGINFITLFNKINLTSPNAAITLYIITLMSVIPLIGFLQGILISLPIMIIILYDKHHSEKKGVEESKKRTGK